jgi:hypothetical protein
VQAWAPAEELAAKNHGDANRVLSVDVVEVTWKRAK